MTDHIGVDVVVHVARLVLTTVCGRCGAVGGQNVVVVVHGKAICHPLNVATKGRDAFADQQENY